MEAGWADLLGLPVWGSSWHARYSLTYLTTVNSLLLYKVITFPSLFVSPLYQMNSLEEGVTGNLITCELKIRCLSKPLKKTLMNGCQFLMNSKIQG